MSRTTRKRRPRSDLERAVLAAMEPFAGQCVLVAVSGGADSVSLAAALAHLAGRLGLRLVLAHLNHCLRGGEAAEDVRFVKRLGRTLKVRVIAGRSPVRARARRKHISLEMAGRQARYEFFQETARKLGATAVATAHTADDQAETVVLRLARGSGASGLAGIRPVAVRSGLSLVRPLLRVTRAQVEAYLHRRGISWREDASNRSDAFLRNRVRNEILPLVQARLNPQLASALCRTADILQEEDAWMDSMARLILDLCRLPGTAGRSGLDADLLRAYPSAAVRRVLRAWCLEAGAAADALGYDAVMRLARLLARKRGSGEAQLAGLRVCRRYHELRIETASGTAAGHAPFRTGVAVPGETLLPEAGLRIVTVLEPGVTKPRGTRAGVLPSRATIAAARVGRAKLVARSRRAGDRMRPLGLKGTKKLQDIFVDAKVPADLRPGVPVFECRGEIVWLPGYRVARGWEVTDPATPNLHLFVERL